MLHWAAAKKRTECFNFFLNDKAIDVAAVDAAGDTPMHLAARHGHLEIAVILLEKSPNLITLKNSIGLTPRDYQDAVFWTKVGDRSPRNSPRIAETVTKELPRGPAK